jgi:hypothetical protein
VKDLERVATGCEPFRAGGSCGGEGASTVGGIVRGGAVDHIGRGVQADTAVAVVVVLFVAAPIGVVLTGEGGLSARLTKTVLTEAGSVARDVPRDREGFLQGEDHAQTAAPFVWCR